MIRQSMTLNCTVSMALPVSIY